VLRDDRLVGRFDPALDRADNVLRIKAWEMQPDTNARDRDAVREAIDELARWLQVDRVEVPRGRL
jgi:uncharacterized protein YcaQ